MVSSIKVSCALHCASGTRATVRSNRLTTSISWDTTSPKGQRDGDIYDVSLPFNVKLPNRNGRVVLQFLVDGEDVRSYVSCSDIELTGATSPISKDKYTCNGHPLCNCTVGDDQQSVGLGLTCPQGREPSITPTGGARGTDIVKQYKDQVGTDEFCALCITNGCPSTCGGEYAGFYQGDKCTNTPIIKGCGATHKSGLPRFVTCTTETCKSSGWIGLPMHVSV